METEAASGVMNEPILAVQVVNHDVSYVVRSRECIGRDLEAALWRKLEQLVVQFAKEEAQNASMSESATKPMDMGVVDMFR